MITAEGQSQGDVWRREEDDTSDGEGRRDACVPLLNS
jgi:hypothetical protein